MKRVKWLRIASVLSLIPCLCLLSCALDKVNGGGTETGNAKVRGKIVTASGAPAAGVKVRLVPVSYDPHPIAKRMAAVDSVTTNQNGEFGFDTAAVGAYNVLADSSGEKMAYSDSITVAADSQTTVPPDTIKAPGSVAGKVRLQPGDDARKVFIIALGTNTFTSPADTSGSFGLSNMAEGSYRVRIMSTLDNYGVLDTVLPVAAGRADTLASDIVLPYTGISVPAGLKITYDTLKQIVTLSWNKPTTGRPVASYTIYRKRSDSTTTAILASGVTDTVYRDSTGVQDQTYEYRVAAIDAQGSEGVKGAGVAGNIVGMFVVSDSIVKGYGNLDGNFGHMARGVCDTNGNYYIVDNSNRWLQKLDSAGNFVFKVDSFQVPISITNHADSFLYVCDDDAWRIVRTDLGGHISKTFSTTGRPSGICTRSDTVFVSSDSGIEIYSLDGDPLGIIHFQFYRWLSQPQVVNGQDGELYVVEDRGLFKIDYALQAVRSIWSFADQHANQQAQVATYNGDTLMVVGSGGNPPFATSIYLIRTDGSLIGRCKYRYAVGGITRSGRKGMVAFSSQGKILFLKRR